MFIESNLFFKGVPIPVINFIASLAWIEPITPGVTPKTGNDLFSSSFNLKIHSIHGVSSGIIVVTCRCNLPS